MNVPALLAANERKDLLRLLTAGSVDDGKSTLIGRLLHDSRQLFADQLDSLTRDSERYGTTGTIDLALLMDGLRAEREQGITIDVAYRFFSTAKRKFIIADTPGHEQYTRNMATGASTCDLAIILIDARHGVLPQTCRHSFIATLLGIRHLVVAINKMDAVDYSEEVFERIRKQYSDFAAKLEATDIHFIPISALRGDNVVNPSADMPWYHGGSLLDYLESVHIASDRNLIDLRFPVQHVIRPSHTFRGYAGTIVSGILRKGAEVVALPSGRRSRIASIVTFDGELEEAPAPLAVTMTLEDDIDVSRGDLIVHVNNQPIISRELEVMLVWMSDQPLRLNHPYLMKFGPRQIPVTVEKLLYRLNVNTLHREHDEELGLNAIGRVIIESRQPVCYDPYVVNRSTGRLILIDRVTNATLAAGMILARHSATIGELNTDRTAATVRRPGAVVRLNELEASPAESTMESLTQLLWDNGFQVLAITPRMISKALGDEADQREAADVLARYAQADGQIVLLHPDVPLARETRQWIGRLDASVAIGGSIVNGAPVYTVTSLTQGHEADVLSTSSSLTGAAKFLLHHLAQHT